MKLKKPAKNAVCEHWILRMENKAGHHFHCIFFDKGMYF